MKEFRVGMYQVVDSKTTVEFDALVSDYSSGVVELLWLTWKHLSPGQRELVLEEMAGGGIDE